MTVIKFPKAKKPRPIVLAAGLLFWAAPALGQGLPIDLTLPPASVIGRPSTIGPGQATAIPFAQLASQLSQFGLLASPLTLSEFPVIGANTALGSVAGGTPVALSSTQVTAMIGVATASLSGALPAWPNNITTFFRGDGSYATLNVAAIGGFGTGVATALGNATNATGGLVGFSGALGTPTAGVIGTGLTLGGVTMGLGSDATGDIYYNNGGVLTRLPKGTNGQALELVSGIPAWASVSGTGTITACGSATSGACAMPYFTAYLSSSQTITTGSTVKLQINTKESDSNTWYDAATNFRFTPQLAGRYRVGGNVLCQGTSVTACYLIIYKNGSPYGEYANTLTNASVASAVSKTITFNGSTDYVELWLTINCTGTCVAFGTTAPEFTWFEANYISP